MSNLEDRLRAAGRPLGSQPVHIPPLAAVLRDARRRKTRRRVAAGVGVLAALVMLSTAATRRPASRTSNVASTPGQSTTTGIPPTTSTLPPTTTPPTSPTTSTANTSRQTPAGNVKPAPTTTAPAGNEGVSISNGVWVVGVDGSGLHQVSLDSGPMSWSPDSQRIAVVVRDKIWLLSVKDPRQATTLPVGAEGAGCLDWSVRGELAWVTTDGTLRASSNATDSRELATGLSGQPHSCRWSPDGSMIAIGTDSLSVYTDGGDLIGRRPPQVTGWATASVAWSYDGTRVAALETRNDGKAYLIIIDPRGDWSDPAANVPPGDNEGNGGSVTWDRGGSQLYYHSPVTYGGSLYRIDAASRQGTLIRDACCAMISELSDGRFAGLGWVGELPRRTVVVSDHNLTSSIELARARPRRPDDSPYVCRGAYLEEERPAPNERVIAFSASSAYGPRCDSPE